MKKTAKQTRQRKTLTKQQTNILKKIIQESVWYYALDKVASNKTVLATFRKFASMDLIEVKEKKIQLFRGRPRKYWGLTLVGLLYGVKQGLILPEHARDIRLKHYLKLPKVEKNMLEPFIPESRGEENPLYLLCLFVEEIEKNNTKEFYEFLARGPYLPKKEIVPGLFNMVAVFLLFKAYGRKDKFLEKYIRGEDLLLPNGEKIEDFKSAYNKIKNMLNAFGWGKVFLG